ncbi:MAG: DUF3516 domain-containing protein [Oligoflexia bacterium]|nr:DUF3516 domain-containing protein [Oligoflexia bacterium]
MNEYSLLNLLAKKDDNNDSDNNSDQILEKFLSYIDQLKINLYPAQEEAILELFEGNNVILNTPTGSGKSLVAVAMHFRAMFLKRRSIYSSPIKALVNEKFLSLCYDFGADSVGLITGDASVNTKAPIICCTAEILANMALRRGELTEFDDIVIDEFHFYADRERGVAWQIPLLTLPHCRFLLMSATMGDCTFFEKELSKLTSATTKTILSLKRPIPLDYKYEEYPLDMTVDKLVSEGKTPIYLVNFTQRECAEIAQSLTCVNYCSKEEKQKIAERIKDVKFTSPYGKDINRLIRHGVGIHHAGLLPKYRLLVEKLAQDGLLKIICGTDTLGVGINVPIKTVLFTKLCKFNGEKMVLLSARDFHQIAGRAGRKGFDDSGTVVVMAPSYIIENKMLEEKSKLKGKNPAKIVKAKAPERGFIPWKRADFDRLVAAPPEPLKSSFKVSHSMILNVLSRENNGCRAMKEIIRNCHESDHSKKRMKSEAWMMFRSLVDRHIVEFVKPTNSLRLNLQLQNDFSLHHALSIFLLDAIELIDPYSLDYNLKVLSLVESIVENPEVILYKQLDKVKRERVFEMKAQGIEYEERMAELEKLEWPKPEREFIYQTFNHFKVLYPWVQDESIQPKSIAREMYETFQSFNDYIREYTIERSEGLLLRYLSDVYRVLSQNIPEKMKNEALMDVTLYIETIIREIDSSLLEEWEKLKDPLAYNRKKLAKEKELEEEKVLQGILADLNAFTNQIRNAVFRFIRTLAFERWEEALTLIENQSDWPVIDISNTFDKYFEEHKEISIGPNARNKKHTTIIRDNAKENKIWIVKQRLVDVDEQNDWSVCFEVDLSKSQELNRPALYLKEIKEISNSDSDSESYSESESESE